MSRTTRTLLMLAACVAVTVPAWAQLAAGCPDECRNGGFEVDENDFDAFSYDLTGKSTPDNNPAPDHWSWAGTGFQRVSTTDLPPGNPIGDTHILQFANTTAESSGWLWQCVDETLAVWEYDDNGWKHGTNTCWKPGTSKEITVEYDYKFTENSTYPQSLDVYAWAWTPAGESPEAPTTKPTTFDPTASGWTYNTNPGTGWTFVRRWRNEATDDTLAWGQNSHSVVITNYQPMYILWGWNFIQSADLDPEDDVLDPISLDNVSMFGKCGDDSPELSTWLLLASTAAFGGIVRRRRRS